MNKFELTEQLLEGITYDTALPQDWLDEIVRITNEDYHEVLFSFVWVYEEGYIYGRPFALTELGNRVLADINFIMKTNYPLTPNPVNDSEPGFWG
jgi:hypothetical protein